MVYDNSQPSTKNLLYEVAMRIRALRDISGYNADQMSEFTDTTKDEYLAYESGTLDMPFSFIHKCALTFGVEITDIMEGRSAKLTSFAVTRKGEGQITAREKGIEITNLAPNFRKKISEPYFVKYEYDESLQNKPIVLATHSGQEFDYVVSGRLKVQVGNNAVILNEGDSIYYDSSTPHGMIAVDGNDCVFVAVVLPGEETEESAVSETIIGTKYTDDRQFVFNNFIDVVEDENGSLKNISFKNEDKFNFAFDVVDAIADKTPDKLAMIYVDNDKNDQKFTFSDLKRSSSRAANYFKSLGIGKGDRVLLVLKRHHQFWTSILALHKLGAVAIPATNQLLEKDFEYRFNSANVKAILCTGDGDTAAEVDKAIKKSPSVVHKIMVHGTREGGVTLMKNVLCSALISHVQKILHAEMIR